MSDPERSHRLRRAYLTGAARHAVTFTPPLAGHMVAPNLKARAR
jgi:hypothetical protein